MPTIALACVFIALSRAAVAVSSVMNFSQLLRHVEDRFRGRVFATLESLTWSTMMISMMAAGAATIRFTPQQIGAVAGVASSLTAVFWLWANMTGRLPEPPPQAVTEIEEKQQEADAVAAEPPLS